MDAVHRVSTPTFAGRADELAALRGALGRAAAGAPAITLVGGQSGVGKSRLAAEHGARAARAGARVLAGRCLEPGGAPVPYAPLAEALRPVAGELAGCGAGHVAALAGLLPGIRAPEPPGDREGGSQARVFAALAALLGRLGRGRPVVLVLEDLHRADPSTRAFLAFLARRVPPVPLALVATYRSDELHRRHPLRPLLAELTHAPGVDRLELAPFRRDELHAHVSAILGAPAPGDLADRLFERSGGNPLHAEALLAGSRPTAPGSPCGGPQPPAPAWGGADAPGSLRALLLARVERLPAGAREVARIVSVGAPMGRGLLGELAGLDAGELRRALREAVAHGVLAAGPGGTYAFRHAPAGEAVYADLLPGERSALHARLAAAVEADPERLGGAPAAAVAAVVAGHWDAAHDAPRALGAGIAAGLAAEGVLAFAEAGRHLARALELWDRVPDAAERAGLDRAEVLRRAAAAAAGCGEAARSRALARAAGGGTRAGRPGPARAAASV